MASKKIRHIALLAKLHVTDQEMEPLERHLNGILGHFERLKGLDLDNVDPSAREDLDMTPWREDVVRNWGGREESLSQAPAREGDFFRVPRIVEGNDE